MSDNLFLENQAGVLRIVGGGVGSVVDLTSTMFDWLQYRYKLARFHGEKTRAPRARATVWRRAARGKPKDSDLENIKSGKWRDNRLIDDDIYQLTSDYLQRAAERHFLAVPEFSHIISHFPDRWRLTRSAMLDLRAAIRAEQKERSELFRSWLSGITGLIGVLIGLLAIIPHRR